MTTDALRWKELERIYIAAGDEMGPAILRGDIHEVDALLRIQAAAIATHHALTRAFKSNERRRA